MFKTRLLSGIVLVIAAIFLIVTGNEVLLFSTLLISCIGMFELFRVFKFEKSLLSVVPYIALILFYINLRWSFIPDVMMLFMGFLIVLMFVYVLSYPKYDAKQLMAAFFGMFYVGAMLSYVSRYVHSTTDFTLPSWYFYAHGAVIHAPTASEC